MKTLLLLIKKDIWLHLSNSYVFFNYLMFSVTVYVVIRFTAGEGNMIYSGISSYWTAYFFSGYLALTKIVQNEVRNHSHLAVQIICPNSTYIYLASLLSLLLLLSAGQFILLPVHALFFNLDLFGYFWQFSILFVLITAGFNAIIVLFGRLLAELPQIDFLLPVICFPVQVPLIISAVKLTELIFNGESFANMQDWLVLLLFYDLIFLIAGYILTVLIFE